MASEQRGDRRPIRPVLLITAGVLVGVAVLNVAVPQDTPFGARVNGSVVALFIAAVAAMVGGISHLPPLERLAESIRVADLKTAVRLRRVAVAAIVIGVALSVSATFSFGSDQVTYQLPGALRFAGGTLLWLGVFGLWFARRSLRTTWPGGAPPPRRATPRVPST